MDPTAASVTLGETLEPTLNNIIQKESLKWIFVGGKGGVGKTTCSCSLAIQLAKVRPSVLLISTDPAHNLSDAFSQKFTKEPQLINGFTNLYAMEVDPAASLEGDETAQLSSQFGISASTFQELATSIPGIDEAMSFTEVMKLAAQKAYSCVVFDTAPTGHTLRLLSMPGTLESSFGKLMSLKDRFGGMMQQMLGMMGNQFDINDLLGPRLDQIRDSITSVNKDFRDPDLTTFVCVCIPEFLSLYETERLVQDLNKFDIDTQNIIVNQVLFPDAGGNCSLCRARSAMQQRYLDQIRELYDLFHIVVLPLLPLEQRGTANLRAFSELLLHPFTGTSGAGLPAAAAAAPSSSSTAGDSSK